MSHKRIFLRSLVLTPMALAVSIAYGQNTKTEPDRARDAFAAPERYAARG